MMSTEALEPNTCVTTSMGDAFTHREWVGRCLSVVKGNDVASSSV
jgi:hypothetical protein